MKTQWTQEGTAIYQGDCKIAQCLDAEAEELYGTAILPREEYRDLLVPYEKAAEHARLIASAPDLLAALRNLLSDAEANDMADSDWSGSLIEARKALAKATK